VAERELDPALYPGANPADLVAGALVFRPTSGPVDLRDWRQWWEWEPGAYWRHPFGPDSGIEELRQKLEKIPFDRGDGEHKRMRRVA